MTTFATLQQMLTESVNRSDKEHLYDEWINRAIRTIQQDNTFNRLRTKREVTVPIGGSSVSLPDDFNQFTRERDPVRVKGGGNNAIDYPCRLMTEEEVINFKSAALYPVSPISVLGSNIGLPVFLTYDEDEHQVLNLFSGAADAITFVVSFFRYTRELVQPEDTNFLLQDYPELVIAKVKSIAFTDVNDSLGGDFESLYRRLLPSAMIDDDRKWRAGRPRKMGGGR